MKLSKNNIRLHNLRQRLHKIHRSEQTKQYFFREEKS